MVRIALAVVLLVALLGGGLPRACSLSWPACSAPHSPELAAIVQRYWTIEPGLNTPRMRAAREGQYWHAAQAMHNDCLAAGLDRGEPVRAEIHGVPVYWANGYAEVNEPGCILLVTANPNQPATAIATGKRTAAYAWAGAGAEAWAGARTDKSPPTNRTAQRK
jgi:hypothetical protein